MLSQRIIIKSYIYVQWSCYQGDRRKPHKQALVLLAIDYNALISRERILFSLLFSILSMIWAPSVMQGKDQREAGSRLITFPIFFFLLRIVCRAFLRSLSLKNNSELFLVPGVSPTWFTPDLVALSLSCQDALLSKMFNRLPKSRRIFCTVCGSAEGLDWRLDFSSNFKTRFHFHIFTDPTCRKP